MPTADRELDRSRIRQPTLPLISPSEDTTVTDRCSVLGFSASAHSLHALSAEPSPAARARRSSGDHRGDRLLGLRARRLRSRGAESATCVPRASLDSHRSLAGLPLVYAISGRRAAFRFDGPFFTGSSPGRTVGRSAAVPAEGAVDLRQLDRRRDGGCDSWYYSGQRASTWSDRRSPTDRRSPAAMTSGAPSVALGRRPPAGATGALAAGLHQRFATVPPISTTTSTPITSTWTTAARVTPTPRSARGHRSRRRRYRPSAATSRTPRSRSAETWDAATCTAVGHVLDRLGLDDAMDAPGSLVWLPRRLGGPGTRLDAARGGRGVLAAGDHFALVGSGWRARMFLEVARELGTVRCGGVVVRTPRRLEVPTFTSLDACLRELRPDFVLTATPWSVTPASSPRPSSAGCRCWPRPRPPPTSTACGRSGRRSATPGWSRSPSST